MAHTVPTPRRGYFSFHDPDLNPTSHESTSLLPPRSPALSSFDDPAPPPLSPGGIPIATPRIQIGDKRVEIGLVPAKARKKEKKWSEKKYEDKGVVGKGAIVVAVIVATAMLCALVLLNRDATSIASTTPTASPAAPLTDPPAHSSSGEFATIFPDWHEQCHNYYSFEGPLDHSQNYLDSGSHDPQELARWRDDDQPKTVCQRSVTYFLDSEFGLFYHLTAIAQAYALARLSSRAFFIDDTNWDRGVWTDHFLPLPNFGCKRPSPERMKACPRGTRHWALDARTLHYHFGHEYQVAFEDSPSARKDRKKPSFDLSRYSFEEILIPSHKNARLIRTAREELRSEMAKFGAEGNYIGVHVRRGDRKPVSWFLRDSNVPLKDFRRKIAELWKQHGKFEELVAPSPFIHLASSFSTTLLPEFSDSNTYSLSTSSHASLRALSSSRPYTQSKFSELDLPTRILQTRGMMVDFDLLTGGWRLPGDDLPLVLKDRDGITKRHSGDAEEEQPHVGWMQKKDQVPLGVVCTLSSNVCKMAAVAMGWERAFVQKRWVDVDGEGEFGWRPTEVP